MTPLITSLDGPSPLLERTELTSVFSNFVDIWNLHRSFSESLHSLLANFLANPHDTLPPPLSPILISHFPFLSLYTPFVTTFPNLINKLASLLETNTAFLMFIKTQEEDVRCGKLKLQDWLLTIVQRCPRYVLLLKDLIDCTDVHDPEHTRLVAAKATLTRGAYSSGPVSDSKIDVCCSHEFSRNFSRNACADACIAKPPTKHNKSSNPTHLPWARPSQAGHPCATR